MKESTVIFNVDLTMVVKDHDTTPFLEDEAKKRIASHIKECLGIDDAQVKDVKVFINRE